MHQAAVRAVPQQKHHQLRGGDREAQHEHWLSGASSLTRAGSAACGTAEQIRCTAELHTKRAVEALIHTAQLHTKRVVRPFTCQYSSPSCCGAAGVASSSPPTSGAPVACAHTSSRARLGLCTPGGRRGCRRVPSKAGTWQSHTASSNGDLVMCTSVPSHQATRTCICSSCWLASACRAAQPPAPLSATSFARKARQSPSTCGGCASSSPGLVSSPPPDAAAAATLRRGRRAAVRCH